LAVGEAIRKIRSSTLFSSRTLGPEKKRLKKATQARNGGVTPTTGSQPLMYCPRRGREMGGFRNWKKDWETGAKRGVSESELGHFAAGIKEGNLDYGGAGENKGRT